VLAHRPADAEPPYGYGQVEVVSAGFDVSGMVLLAGLVMVLHAIGQLVNGVHVNESNLRIGLALMLLATIIRSACATRSQARRGARISTQPVST
jgi:divalent metal cation (Fe/Co/Zn/Cd) transporter